MANLLKAHTKVKVIHAVKQHENTPPLIVEDNITFTASSINELFSAICQDGIRFSSIYDGNYKFIRHLIIPIKEIKIESINAKTIKISIQPSKSPKFEVVVYHPSEIINNSAIFDNSVIRTLTRNHQTTYQRQIDDYFGNNECYLNALEIFTNIISSINNQY